MTPATRIQQTREAFSRLTGLGKAAIAVAAVAVLLLLPSLWDLAAAVIGPRPNIPPVADAEAKTSERAAAFEGYVAQAQGRSLFYNPDLAPAAPPPPPDETSHEPSKPTTYAGPAPVAMVFDEVWFSDGSRMKVGDPEKNDLRVTAINAPWSATVTWKGVEFQIDLFKRNNVVFKDAAGNGDPAPASSPDPSEEPEPEPAAEPAKPAAPSSPPPASGPETPPATPPPQELPPSPAPETPPEEPPAEPPEHATLTATTPTTPTNALHDRNR